MHKLILHCHSDNEGQQFLHSTPNNTKSVQKLDLKLNLFINCIIQMLWARRVENVPFSQILGAFTTFDINIDLEE